nr:MFS transporter [Halovivax cerinus]
MAVVTSTIRSFGALRGGGRGSILLAVAFGWFLSISVRTIYPALLPRIRAAYGLSLTAAGLLLTVLWVAYAAGQLPGGVLTDWIGERLLLVVSSVLAAMTLSLVVLADAPVVLFVATALFGAGTALYGTSRFTILQRVFPDQLGTATGATMAAGDVGNAVMPPVAGVIATAVAWQYGLGFAVPLFLLAAVGLWTTLPGRQTAATPLREQLSPPDLWRTLSQPFVLRRTLLLVLWAVLFQAFVGFYPTYLMDVATVPSPVATALFGFFFALGIPTKPLAGRAYDRVGVRTPLVVIMGATAVSFAAVPFASGLPTFVVLTALAAGVLGFETIVISDLTGRLPDRTRGTSLGAIRTVYIGLGAVSPLLVGAVADAGHFDAAFFAIAALAGLTGLYAFVAIDV